MWYSTLLAEWWLQWRWTQAQRAYFKAREITEYDEIPEAAQTAYRAALYARTPQELRAALPALRFHTEDLIAYPYT